MEQCPPMKKGPNNGIAKTAVYIKCSMNGCTDPVIGSVTNAVHIDGWWWWGREYVLQLNRQTP
jgi:hypothetical protein